MATNMVFNPGNELSLTVPSGITSGDPVRINKFMSGVALTDRDSTTGKATVALEGVFDLSVKGIDDADGNAVAIGDPIYYVAGDTPVLSKKESGQLFGHALEAVAVDATATIQVRLVGCSGNALDGRRVVELFETTPICSNDDGTACSTDGTNVMILSGVTTWEYTPKGANTVTAPSISAAGLTISLSPVDDAGVEYNNGITARNKSAFVIGTDAFYGKFTFTIEDVSGTDDCAFGFRAAAANQAAIDNYTDMAALNVISGDIKIETILNNAATTTTDTTDNWADGATHTLEVYVSSAGVVTYKIDGAAPTVTAAFTFDSTDTVIPFFYYLNATDLSVITAKRWEVGLQ